MTSPDRKVPSGAYVGSSAPNNVANLANVNWAGIEQATVANLMGSFQGVSTASQSMNGNNATSATAAEAAASGSGTAQSTASAAQNTAAANSVSIAGLQGPPPQPTGPAVTFSDNFTRAALGADYTTFKNGTVTDLVIIGNQVRLDPGGTNTGGDVMALHATKAATDNQSVSLTMGSGPDAAYSGTGLILRADPQLATFAYIWAFAGKISIGAGRRSGGTHYYNDWAVMPYPVNPGDTVTFTVVGKNYQVLVNNYPVIGYTDAAESVPAGAGARSLGFGLSVTNSKLSYTATALTAGDKPSIPATGIGWSLSRASTTALDQPAGTLRRINGVFDTLGQAANVSIINLGAGQVQVNRAGWYLITAKFQVGAFDGAMRTDLWWAPNLGGSWSLLRAGAAGNYLELDGTGGSVCTSGSFVVYLPKGAVVAPGISTNRNNQFTGPFIYFDGALLNWL